MATVQQQAPIPGARKAAVLTLLLAEEQSSAVFKYLREDEIERISKEVSAMGAVQPEIGERVLEEFHSLSGAANSLARGGFDHVRALLHKTVTPDVARRILERLTRSVESTAGFYAIEKADPQQLSKFILGEHPQTIALILAHLNASNAAQLVALLPDGMRADVLTRMANLEEISPEVIRSISAVIDSRLKALGGPQRESYGGVRAVAELFNRLDRGISQPVLESIENDTPDLAVSIRNLMFVFDDLAGVEEQGLREIIQRIDKKVLTIALKGATDDIKNRFFNNMSKRAADMMREEMEVLGAIRLREVEKAQQEVVAVARKLEEEGVIVTGAAAGEPYVV